MRAHMRSAVLDGVTLEYEVRGAGDPVVLIHLAPYADSFLPLMDQPALSDYQLIRYRRRGYGGSAEKSDRVTISENARDLAGLLRFLEIRRAHIVGHSYGGLVGLQLALDRPEAAGSLVLMEPSPRTARNCTPPATPATTSATSPSPDNLPLTARNRRTPTARSRAASPGTR